MRRATASLSTIVIAFALVSTHAQVRPIYDMGAAGLMNVLGRLQTTASVLHTGAHPDDEDSAFMARAARGDHARTAYLALNRGEGGQNILGPELFDALGVIRTEELLQARRLDGGEQFFTRAFDYGFSKSREEASAKWDERQVLGDMVRIIRTFRPLVIYSRFTGTPADGHGHHQMAGYLTPLAFKAAADPAQFSEQLTEGLRPWQAKKLYRGIGFRPDPSIQPTIQVQEGMVDPVVGRSFAEISFEGRSQHKSQEMGGLEIRGPVASPLLLIDGMATPSRQEQSVFDGIDVSVPGLAALAGLPPGALRSELQAIDAAARRALVEYQPRDPAGILPALVAGLQATRSARAALGALGAASSVRADAEFLLTEKEDQFIDALTRAAGIVVDPVADSETVVPGHVLGVSVRTFLPDGSPAKIQGATVRTPSGWSVQPASDNRGPDTPAAPGPFRREVPTQETRYRVQVPATASPTQPYFLEQPRRGDSYNWSATAPKGLPFEPPLLSGSVTIQIGDVMFDVVRPVTYRFAHRVRGELRRDVNVVPAVTIGLDSPLMIVPAGATPHQQQLVIRVRSFSPQPVSGTLQVRLPAGWTTEPAESPFSLRTTGEATSATLKIDAPARRTAGTFTATAEAIVDGKTYTQDVQEIAYPHIQTHRIFSPSTATLQVFDIQVAPVKVGYVMGSGDQVPDALRRIGVNVTLIGDEMLAVGNLSQFDTIVVGVRASEARPAFVANAGRLQQYMEQGGTLIVQYQQADYVSQNLAPYPAAEAMNSRVTEELAPVRILAPAHPLFTFPNRITTADFDGWVQERNLYAFTSWDPRYVPLLETQDRGEMPQRGGELYAEVGRGRFVYTAFSWFRQLPAGVPGAYRQFANLVSLSKAPR